MGQVTFILNNMTLLNTDNICLLPVYITGAGTKEPDPILKKWYCIKQKYQFWLCDPDYCSTILLVIDLFTPFVLIIPFRENRASKGALGYFRAENTLVSYICQ